MKKLLFIAFLVLTSATTFAQTDAYSEDVKTLIKQNGVYDYYANVVDDMFTMLKKQYASKNVPDTVWNDLKNVKQDEMKELSQMMVSAYRGYLRHEDIKAMNKMYSTSAGKTMVKNSKQLTDAQKQELGTFYNSESGQTLLTAQPEIDKLMSKISEMWSSTMYRNVVKHLADKGFTLQQ